MYAYNVPLRIAQPVENMYLRPPDREAKPLPRAPPPPAHAPRPLPRPPLVDGQGALRENAPVDDGEIKGAHFDIVPPFESGLSVANQVPLQSSQETLHSLHQVDSTLGLPPQQWYSIGQRPGSPTGRLPPVPRQKFTLPSQGHDNSALTQAVNLIGPTPIVDECAVGDLSSLLQVASWTSSELGWDQSINTNDVLPQDKQPSELNPNFTFGTKPKNTYLLPGLNSINHIKRDSGPRLGHRRSNAISISSNADFRVFAKEFDNNSRGSLESRSLSIDNCVSQGLTNGVPSGYPPLISEAKLRSVLLEFWRSQEIQFNPKNMSVNGQMIDPATFYGLVIEAGGFQKVNETEGWGTIGRKIGVVQLLTRQHSQFDITKYLAHTYREYFLDFEHLYLRTCKARCGEWSQALVWDLGANKANPCHSLLFQLLKDRDQRARVRQLSGDNAQILVNYLDLVCRHGCFPLAQEGRRALSLLGKLAKSAGVFPQRYLLQEVKHHPEPVAGGGFAEVFRGEYRGKPVCIKAIRAYQKQEREEVLKASVQELILWAHLQHKNILPFIGIYFLGSQTSRICLISPWMENGNLREHLNRFPHTPRMPFIHDVVEGLLHLHDLHIVHRDLKTQNVLVSGDGRALIADFGLSCVLATTAMTSNGGTSRFIAPEILLEEGRPTEACDIWSFACLCYEVMTNKLPFYQYKDFRVTRALMDKEIPLRPEQKPGVGHQELNDKIWQLLVNCWSYIPQHRPSCETILLTLGYMNTQGNRQGSGMGGIWQGATADDEFNFIFWQNVKWFNDDVDYARVETILRHVQTPL